MNWKALFQLLCFQVLFHRADRKGLGLHLLADEKISSLKESSGISVAWQIETRGMLYLQTARSERVSLENQSYQLSMAEITPSDIRLFLPFK